MLAGFWWGNLKGRRPWEDLGADERIVLNGCQMRRMGESGLNSYGPKQGQVAGAMNTAIRLRVRCSGVNYSLLRVCHFWRRTLLLGVTKLGEFH